MRKAAKFFVLLSVGLAGMACSQVRADDIECENRYGEHTALYIWSDALQSQSINSILDLAQSQDIERFVLSVGKSSPIEKVDTLKARARQNGIATEFLLAPNYWVRSGDLDDVRSRVKGIDLQGSPLHLNIEPHAYDDFDQREQEYLRRYLEVLRETRKIIGDDKLTVSVPIFWPDSTYRDIASIVDRAYFMAYGEKRPRERAEVTREVARHFAPKQRVVALRPEDYSDPSALNQGIPVLRDVVGTGRFALHDFESFIGFVGNDSYSPIAVNDSFSIVEDHVLRVEAPGILENDCDPDEGPLRTSIVSGPSNGSLTLEAEGSFEYAPDKHYNGTDNFTYEVLSDSNAVDTASVQITIEAVDDSPVAKADTFRTHEDSLLKVGVPGILDNDNDPDGDSLRTSVTADPSNGTLTLWEDGSLEYMPAQDFEGEDSFTYEVTSGSKSDTASVWITVMPVNDAPTLAANAGLTLDEGSTKRITTDLLNVEDPDDLPSDLTFEVTEWPQNGTLEVDDSTLSADRSFTQADLEGGLVEYSHDGSETTSDSFTFDLTDAEGEGSGEETFKIAVNPVDDPPLATDDAYSTDQGKTLRPSASRGLLANDDHPEGKDFHVSETLVSRPENGKVTVSADGSFRYTPDAGFVGTDEFVYEVSDDNLTDTATVAIEVKAVFVSISGSVHYPGEGGSSLTDGRPLGGVPVEVSAVSGDMAVMDTTDGDGNFSVDVRTGKYVVQALVDRDVPDGEINATDANRTIGAYLETNPFVDDFQSEVADVNDSGSANATDAPKMALFFKDPARRTFEAGDWATTAPTVDVSDVSDASVSVLAAAYGDANLSGAEQNAGSAAATTRSTSLHGAKMDGTFQVRVRLGSTATVGSYSLQVDFSADKASFEGVVETDRNVMSAAEEGTVRLSWFDQSGEQPIELASDASLVALRFSGANGAKEGTTFTPEVTAGELAGPNSHLLASPQLSVEGIEFGSVPDGFALQNSYPNPVSNGQATVEMDLPERTIVTIEIYNTLGQRLQTIERSMAPGTEQTLQVDTSQLASGQYFYRVKANLEDGTVKETGQLTVLQ